MISEFVKEKTKRLQYPLHDLNTIYEFVKFRDFLDNSDNLTYLQVICIDCNGKVKIFSALEIEFITLSEENLVRFKEMRQS